MNLRAASVSGALGRASKWTSGVASNFCLVARPFFVAGPNTAATHVGTTDLRTDGGPRSYSRSVTLGHLLADAAPTSASAPQVGSAGRSGLGGVPRSGSSFPSLSSAEMSEKPPTDLPLIKTCGTVRWPDARPYAEVPDGESLRPNANSLRVP